MIEKEFNLLDEDWIPVIYSDSDFQTISLKKAFEDAHLIRTLVGDIPPQDAALYRLMLAVLYCVYSHNDADGNEAPVLDRTDAVERWKGLWIRRRFDADAICSYLDRYHDRFFLFHPERPFYQVNIDKGTEYNAAKLNGALSESANKPRLFSDVSGSSKDSMGYPEAARWLLYVNAFDDTSSKPTRKGENMPSPGAGWVGKLGYIMAIGNNLFETLMMNLVLIDDHGEPFPDGKAVWELEKIRDDERVEVPLPESPQELLTLQDRRLLLKREHERVVGFLLLGGDVVPKENALSEQMTMWYLNKDNELVPRRHDPARALWRDFSSILMRSGDSNPGIHEPGVIRWLSTLLDENALEVSSLNIRATGVKYADKDFFVDDIVDDTISVNSAVLASYGEALNSRINKTVAKTDKCVLILGWLASDIANLNGLDSDRCRTESDKARMDGYMLLDQPFRHWLTKVGSDPDGVENAFNNWDNTMEDILLSKGREIVGNAGTRAMVGNIDKKGRMQNGFSAYRKFRFNLHRTAHGDYDD